MTKVCSKSHRFSISRFLLHKVAESRKRMLSCNASGIYQWPALAASLVLLLLVSCSSAPKYQVSSYANGNNNPVPDYSNLYYWAAHPYKHDPSDSLPVRYRKDYQDSSVDVFFIYPTTYTDKSKIAAEPNGGSRWNANINDDSLNAKTDYTTILNQATPFNHYRVFSPRYRQAHYQSFFIADSISKPFFETAYADVKAAFEYYMVHNNGGRPFIIASHSQGTVHAARLIKELIENNPLAQKMVAAYLIGMPVRTDYFASVLPCKDSLQTGCFVSWRSFREGYIPPYISQENFKATVINPLTWQMNEEAASRKLNEGTILLKFNRVKTRNVSARVNGNILWTSRPRFLGGIFLKQKNYHIADINFFWKSIRDNVQTRVRKFREASGE
ncbi:MAG: DUF3089 domain-containing protein [Bacteroidota bacterium]